MRPLGLERFELLQRDVRARRASEYTPASRTRRAMSWTYCEPKSTIGTTWPRIEGGTSSGAAVGAWSEGAVGGGEAGGVGEGMGGSGVGTVEAR